MLLLRLSNRRDPALGRGGDLMLVFQQPANSGRRRAPFDFTGKSRITGLTLQPLYVRAIGHHPKTTILNGFAKSSHAGHALRA